MEINNYQDERRVIAIIDIDNANLLKIISSDVTISDTTFHNVVYDIVTDEEIYYNLYISRYVNEKAWPIFNKNN